MFLKGDPATFVRVPIEIIQAIAGDVQLSAIRQSVIPISDRLEIELDLLTSLEGNEMPTASTTL